MIHRIVTLLLVTGLAACLPSLQPLSSDPEREAALVPGFEGKWAAEEGEPGGITIEVEQHGARGYRLLVTMHNDKVVYETPLDGFVVRIGEQLVLDTALTKAALDAMPPAQSLHLVPAHQFSRLELDGDRLVLHNVADQFGNAMGKDPDLLRRELTDTHTWDAVLTASSEQIREAIRNFAGGELSFFEKDGMSFRRIPTEAGAR